MLICIKSFGETDCHSPTVSRHNDGTLADQLTLEMSELKKAQQALKKAMQRKNSEINTLLEEQCIQLVDSMPPVPTLTDQELEEIVDTITSEDQHFELDKGSCTPQEEVIQGHLETAKDPMQSNTPPRRLVQYDSSDSD